MQEQMALALEFLDEHPDAAVRTLELHDARQVAAFLEAVPDDYSVQVMELSLPAFAAHLCRVFGVETSARLLLEQSVSRQVAVLRHLERDFVDAVLAECPRSRRNACNLLMYYPLPSIGAWMVPNTALVSIDFTVGEVLNFLKDALEETFSKYVFIVNRAGVPQGRISYLALLKADRGEVVGRLMEAPVATIPGQMLLAQAAKLPCWDSGDVMPVTGQQQQFVGVIRHVDLRRGPQQQVFHSSRPPPGSDSRYAHTRLAGR